MYVVDKNNVITRVSDSKIIPRDITNVDYQTFLYIQRYKTDPATHLPLVGYVNYREKD